MLRIALLSSLGVALMVALGDAFSSPCAFFSLHRSARLERNSYYARNPIIVMAVSDVSNEEAKFLKVSNSNPLDQKYPTAVSVNIWVRTFVVLT